MLNIIFSLLLVLNITNIQKQEMLINAYHDYYITILNINKPIPYMPGGVYAEGYPIARKIFEIFNYEHLEMVGIGYLLMLNFINNEIFCFAISGLHFFAGYTWHMSEIPISPPQILRWNIYWRF